MLGSSATKEGQRAERAGMAGSEGDGRRCRRLDVITIGRSSVDLYGQQIGSRLEDVSSFAKSVGGSPTNIAIGAARLGLKAGLITGVGDEQLGRFIREQLQREGVALDGVKVDPRAADRARHPLGRGRPHLPAALLPRELRRHGAVGSRHRRELHPLRRRDRGHRHAFLQAGPGGGAEEGDADRARGRAKSRLRHRLPPEPLGPRRACGRARSATSAPTRCRSICRRCCRTAT